jgi:hypothetical protein
MRVRKNARRTRRVANEDSEDCITVDDGTGREEAQAAKTGSVNVDDQRDVVQIQQQRTPLLSLLGPSRPLRRQELMRPSLPTLSSGSNAPEFGPSRPPPAHSSLVAPPPVGTAVFPTVIQPSWNIFWARAQVLLEINGQDMAYDVRVLMKKTLPDFFLWYTTEVCPTLATPVIRLRLLDTNRQIVKTVHISRGALTHFQLVKQIVWDTFWGLLSNGKSSSMCIYVSTPAGSTSFATEVALGCNDFKSIGIFKAT